MFLDHARKNKDAHQQIFPKVDIWVAMDILYDSGFGYTVVHIGPGVKRIRQIGGESIGVWC